MLITPIKTKKIVVGDKIEDILNEALPKLSEKSVVVITSKIVSISEKNVIPLTANKENLIRQEADNIFLNNQTDKTFQLLLTIKDNVVVPWAGIDESNGNGAYVLWPKDSMKTAETLWHFVREKFGLQQVGIIISDSTFIPLRTGSVSIGIGWCGLKPIINYIEQPDVFGKPLQYTQTSFIDSLAIAAGITMGEAAEQQPIAIITDIPNMQFVDRPPTKEEINSLHYPIEKDIFGPLLQSVAWEKTSQ